MHILATGLNYKTAPLEVRETIAFSREQLPEALPRLRGEVGEGVILSTCNRTEIYTVTDAPAETAADVRRFLAAYHGLDGHSVPAQLHDLTDEDAVRHLFRVAGGLDSMILGESQILGQVRGALAASAEAQSLSAPVSRLFHRALRTGRRVREETNVGRNALSVSFAAVRLAQQVLGDLSGLRVLLIGAGEAGKLVAQALRTTGIGELIIANRTPERAEELARELEGRAVPFPRLGAAVEDADIVIAATEAPGYLIAADAVLAANGRRSQGMFLFDLALPRNIDPAVASLEKVSLFNIDDLSAIAEENLRERRDSAAGAETIVEEEVERFVQWWETLDAMPLIKELRQRAERLRRRELARALEKMDDPSQEDADLLDDMTRSIVNKLLHAPTVSLKQRSDEEYLRTARELFGIRDDGR